MHPRKLIRKAVKDALVAAATDAGANVFTSRSRPILEYLQKREKVLLVYTSDEASDNSLDNHRRERRLTVTIEGIMGGGDELDDDVDDLAEQVENCIDADPTLGSLLAEQLQLESTASEFGARGNMIVGAFRMDFVCEYSTDLLPENYLPGDEWGDVVENPPIPTMIQVNPQPTAAAYVAQLGPAELDAEPPTDSDLANTDLTLEPAQPAEDATSACDSDSCDIGAFHGDISDAGVEPLTMSVDEDPPP